MQETIVKIWKNIAWVLHNPLFIAITTRMLEITTTLGLIGGFILFFLIRKHKKAFRAHCAKFNKLTTDKDRLNFFPEKIISKITEKMDEGEMITSVFIPQGNFIFGGPMLLFYLYVIAVVVVVVICGVMIWKEMIPFFGPAILLLSITVGKSVIKIIDMFQTFIYVLTDKKAYSYSSAEINEHVLINPKLYIWDLQKITNVFTKEYKDGKVSVIFKKEFVHRKNKLTKKFFGFLYITEEQWKTISPELTEILLQNRREKKENEMKKKEEEEQNAKEKENDENESNGKKEKEEEEEEVIEVGKNN
ncbi:hypothetical protein M0812_17220 [Anaeramoeba flamelloides]|uniref:Uncharacterized protein n=1 Tax=Anaeramoeba flamelloides TaxID=1746091 RepID=A0AAV7ZAP5_9EUKA|nr:hypothetical protein M0812_17220 [Anaeramoeba flamelloides]